MWYQGHTYESQAVYVSDPGPCRRGRCFCQWTDLRYDERIMNLLDMVNFAVASSAIKHTIHGDGNITDDVDTIRSLMDMSFDIKR